MNEIINYNESIFESIKHVDEDGNEYWYARELMNGVNLMGQLIKQLLTVKVVIIMFWTILSEPTKWFI